MATLQELLARKEEIEREIELTKNKERAAAIEQVRNLMTQYGLSLADLSARAAPKTSGRGAKLPAKYRNKATGETWSGRGLQPRWLKAALAAGRKLGDFEL